MPHRYFANAAEQRRALGRFPSAWDGVDWIGAQVLDHYENSWKAFDPESNVETGLHYFERVYDELKGPHWQVFRSSRPQAARWAPPHVYEAIRREFSAFSWRGSINLLNFPTSGMASELETPLARMREIKGNKGYPLMTVSKFLHFYNPGLFPIYDSKVIWERVLAGVFRKEFREFCERAGARYKVLASEDTADFLPYYMRWASSLLSAAHRDFMNVFAEWLGQQPGARLAARSFNAATLYATAFEYTVTGAAELCVP